MAEYKDILLNENNEAIIENGDFKIGSCEGQNAKLLLLSEKGSWRYDPLMGIGLRRMLNVKLTAGQVLTLKREIIKQFKADGSKVTELIITPTIFKLTSERL